VIGENLKTVLTEIEDMRQVIMEYRDFLLSHKDWDFGNDIRFSFVNQLNFILISHNLNLKYFIERISNIDWLKRELHYCSKN